MILTMHYEIKSLRCQVVPEKGRLLYLIKVFTKNSQKLLALPLDEC